MPWATSWLKFQNGYTGFERFQEILAIHPDIEDKKDAVELKDVKGDITFENVSFQYEENTEKVLNHISLNVPAGAYMALVTLLEPVWAITSTPCLAEASFQAE